MIRLAVVGDVERITEIYNQAIRSRQAVGDTEVVTVAQRKAWLELHSKRTPVFVYEENGIVVGYGYLSEYRPGRQALRYVAEISYFVDFSHHKKGIGNKIVQHIIAAAKELGYKNLLAILLSCNSGSMVVLKKNNFDLWGTLPDIVHIDDKIYSHFYYGLKI